MLMIKLRRQVFPVEMVNPPPFSKDSLNSVPFQYPNGSELNFYGLDIGAQINKLYRLTWSPFFLRYSLTSLILRMR
jgi:hypothetical protein